MTCDQSQQIIALYERHALEFDRERCRDLFEKPWLDKFIAHLPQGGTILDIGCGMGEPIAHYLIDKGFKITGIDASKSLIDLCRQKFPDHVWLHADMRALNLDVQFDGLIAWDSFFHLRKEEQVAMFPLFAKHTQKGAPLMFTTGSEEGETMGTWHNKPLYHASMSLEAYTERLKAHGFAPIDFVLHDPDCGYHTVWLAQKL